jgi:hypothetical protein
MKNWTIRKRIVTGFATLLTLFIVIAVSTGVLLREINHVADNIATDALPGVATAAKLRERSAELQLAMQSHVMATTLEEKNRVKAHLDDLAAGNAKILAAYEKSIFRADDRTKFEHLRGVRAAYNAGRVPVLELSFADKQAEAMHLIRTSLHPLYAAYAKGCQDLFDNNEALALSSSALIQGLLAQARSPS